jgi:hypothetical protein
VHWDKCSNKWHGQVTHQGRRISVGYFVAIEDAELAVITKRLELFTHNDVDLAVL